MPRRPLIVVLAAIPVAVGLIWAIACHATAAFIAARWGGALLQMSDGKFTDPKRFLEMRLGDLALLIASVCLVALAHLIIVSGLNRKTPLRYHWMTSAISGFVCLNLCALIASHTALFWCALFSGKKHSHNYTQYEIKSLLLKENATLKQALLIGNSQTRAQLDPKLFNQMLGDRLWTTELHFPGGRPYDVGLSFSKLPNIHPEFAVCYLTEGYFYSGVDSEGLLYFQNWRDLPIFFHLGGDLSFVGKHFWYGLFGDTIPLFRLREPLTSRLFGFRLMNLPQEKYDVDLKVDLAERAKQAANAYRLDAATEFQKKAFLDLAASCRKDGTKLIVCAGQMNPIFSRALPPALRLDMLQFLRTTANEDSNIVLLDENVLPSQTSEDYDDLTHCNLAAQARFTKYMTGILEKLIAGEPAAAK